MIKTRVEGLWANNCFKYCLPDRVFDVGGAAMSSTREDSSSPELVRRHLPRFLL